MAVDPRQELHDLVDRLNDAEAQRLSKALRDAHLTDVTRRPRPLTDDDILIHTPIMPDDESADDLIAASRRWRHESGHV